MAHQLLQVCSVESTFARRPCCGHRGPEQTVLRSELGPVASLACHTDGNIDLGCDISVTVT